MPQICVDFAVFPDNLPFPNGIGFPAGLFIYSTVGGPAGLLINKNAGVMGLRFPDTGLRIKIVIPSTRIYMVVGFGPLRITLFGSTGTPVASSRVVATGTYVPKNFNLPRKVSRIEIVGGNGEGTLAKLCAVV